MNGSTILRIFFDFFYFSFVRINFFIPLRPNLKFVLWCNGSTTDFGSVCLGSNPGGTTKAAIYTIAAFAIL